MGYWWCPNCKEELSGNQVTYYEKCEDCGTSVIWIDDKYADINIEEVLEKQVLKIILVKDRGIAYCPNCESDIHGKGRMNYCLHCGQKLEWYNN